MVGPVYDDIAGPSARFGGPFGVYMRQYERLVEKWARGISLLKKAYEGRTVDATDQMLLECAEVSYLHFASSLNHLRYIEKRGGEDKQETLLREEEALAIREAELMGKNPTIGFEATNHYFFTRTDLFEKVLNCRYLLGELE
jgi:hypothetical protein